MHCVHRLRRSQLIRAPLPRTFEFFSEPSNLEALTPDFLRFRILTPMPLEMGAGTRIEYALSLYRVPFRWQTLITEWVPGERFVDEQEAGPYAYWRHTHEFEAQGDNTMVSDLVEYREPLGVLGQVAHAAFVEGTLVKIFDFRREQTKRLLEYR
jgi:ligand-binding SRPBCC domain-containing protein